MVHQQPTLNAEAVGYFRDWVLGREAIRVARDAGEPAPWYHDKYLTDYRYCNVRREDDTNSRWLIENIANSDVLIEHKIADMIGARMYNNLETMSKYFPIQSDDTLNAMDEELESGFLCNAYMPVNHQYCAGFWAEKLGKSNGKTPSGKPAYYRPSNLARLARSFEIDGTIDEICIAADMIGAEEKVYDILRGLPTMGDFMAYQHFVDLTYIPELGLSEDIFTIAGPGCVMGLQCLFAEDLTDDYRNSNNTPNLKFITNWGDKSPNELCLWLRDNFLDIVPEWPYDWNPTVMSIENILCEVHKYIKLRKGWGSPRNKYEAPRRTLWEIK